jgi:hypothetical protein
MPVTWRPPDAPGRDPLGQGPWYRSADGRLATPGWPLVAGDRGNKVLWLKPVGSRLEVSGRRLDGQSPPLRAQLHGPLAYSGDFEASGIYVPTPGCWEIEARADGTHLRFVVMIG